jgi:hypothetical protein
MALVDTRGFDFGQGVTQEAQQFTQMLGQGQQVQAQELALGQQRGQLDRAAQIRQLLGQAGQQAPQTEQQQQLAAQTAGLGGEQALAEQPRALLSEDDLKAQARRIDPVLANKALKEMGFDDETKRAEASRFAAQLQTMPFDRRADMINARAQSLQSQGRDPKDTIQLLDMDEAQQNEAITGIQLLDLSTKERFAVRERQAAVSRKRIESKDVKSSKILDDGTTIQVLKSGETAVTDPQGNILEGEERSQAIRDAQEFGVDVQQRRAKGRATGAGTGKAALKSFERVGKIRENIVDLQKGIDLIEKEGATTGFIQDFLPNMKASTRKLANLRRKLGLNVVGAVTFGALSKGELDLAMDVALPKGISPEETVKWIKDRISAQEKLALNMEDAALFLSDHSVAELIQRNRDMAKAAKKKSEVKTPQAAQPQVLIFNPTTGKLE